MAPMDQTAPHFADPIPANALPNRAGIGLKAQHYQELHDGLPDDIGWLEVHSENHMCAGGPTSHWLNAFRERYPISLHGVGMSLGSAGPLDPVHLQRLVDLDGRVEAARISEHLSWSIARNATGGGDYLNDLIALPYTEESLDIFATHVIEMQDALKRPVLIENPSSYLRYEHSVIAEPEFLCEVVKRTDCGVLLDVNNVYVSARNHGFDAHEYIAQVPGERVGEIHLAGHSQTTFNGRTIRIDDHGSPVCDAVWDLYAHTIERIGAKPTLIEWDSNIPELNVLLGEARKADAILAAAQSKPEVRHAAAI